MLAVGLDAFSVDFWGIYSRQNLDVQEIYGVWDCMSSVSQLLLPTEKQVHYAHDARTAYPLKLRSNDILI